MLSTATVLTVTSTADAGAGSLRNQIVAASPGDSIDFNLSYPATIFLNTTIQPGKNIEIFGPGRSNLTIASLAGAVIFDSQTNDFYLDSVTLSIPNNYAIDASGQTEIRFCDFLNGHAVRYQGASTLEMDYCQITSSGFFGTAGLIHIDDPTTTCTVDILKCALIGTGGTYLVTPELYGSFTSTSTTYSTSGTACIHFPGYNGGTPSCNFLNCTFYASAGTCFSNACCTGPSVPHAVTLENSILYSIPNNAFTIAASTVNYTSNGGNVVGDNTGSAFMIGAGDQNATNPQINLALAYNDGFTQNHMLLATSPAINNSTASAPGTDQRDYGRDGTADAGAVEYCIAPTNPTAAAVSTTICEGDSLVLYVGSGTLNSATDWQWYTDSCGGTSAGTGDTIYLFPTASETYYVIGEGGCPPSSACDSITITVNQDTIVPTTASICPNDSMLLGGQYRTIPGTYDDTLATFQGCDSIVRTTLSILVEPLTQLSQDICPADSAFLQNAWQTTAGTYYDTLTAANGCDSIVETILTLTDTIDPQITCPTDIESCNPVVSFTIPIGTDNCPGDSTTQIDGTGLTSGSTFPEGVTTLQWQVSDYTGNTATCSFNVTVHPQVVANAGPDLTVPCKESTQIGATITGATTISWTPTTGLDDPSSATPSATIEETTTYTVIASNANCSDTDMVTLTVDQNVDLIINNMLTPNGDGKNDTWDVNKPALLDGCKVVVFNRWGSIVWSSTGYNNEWDGKNNGMNCPEGTYWYSIKCDDGKYKGQITLVR